MFSYLAYCLAGNFREKTFANFTVLWLFAKVFSAKFGTWCPLARDKQAIHKSFYCVFYQSMKVSPSKVFRSTLCN